MAVLDTFWHGNPKVLALGLPAMGLHAWSISYCDGLLTDGFVPEGALPQLPGMRQAVRRLVDAGRWQEVAGGYRVHDYLVHNRSRAQIIAERAERAKERELDRLRKASARKNGHVR